MGSCSVVTLTEALPQCVRMRACAVRAPRLHDKFPPAPAGARRSQSGPAGFILNPTAFDHPRMLALGRWLGGLWPTQSCLSKALWLSEAGAWWAAGWASAPAGTGMGRARGAGPEEAGGSWWRPAAERCACRVVWEALVSGGCGRRALEGTWRDKGVALQAWQ